MGGPPPGGPPMGGPPPGGPLPGPQGVSEKMGAMQSVFNPADITAMIQRGEITPQTKFGEVLAKMGISPDDTVMEVVQKTRQEAVKSNPLEKMKALSPGAGPPPGPPQAPLGPGGPGPGMPPAPGGRRPSGSVDKLFGVRG